MNQTNELLTIIAILLLIIIITLLDAWKFIGYTALGIFALLFLGNILTGIERLNSKIKKRKLINSKLKTINSKIKLKESLGYDVSELRSEHKELLNKIDSIKFFNK